MEWLVSFQQVLPTFAYPVSLLKKNPIFSERVGTLGKQTSQSPPGAVWDCQQSPLQNPVWLSALATTLSLHPPVYPLRDAKPVQTAFPLKPIYLRALGQSHAVQKMAKTPDHRNCILKIFLMAKSPIPWMLRAEGNSLQGGTPHLGCPLLG